jgi:DNA-binding MarR family transcriptional regulator
VHDRRSQPPTPDTPTDPDSLEDPPQRRISLPFDIFELSTRLGTYLGHALEGTGVRPAEYAVYSLMLEAGPRTPSELAAMLGMPLSTMSTYLAAMLGRGDAKRIPNPSDGRSVRVVLTDRGRGVVRMVNPPFTRALITLESNLDTPVGDVRATLRDILDAIERADADLQADPQEPEADTTSS